MVKRIMAVAVSGITYLRGIFPEDAYSTHYLEDLCVKVLREDSIYPRVSKIVKWMKGCFEALEKKYLQMMILGVQKDTANPNNLIESYQFKFRYTSKGPQMDVFSNKKTNLTNDATEDIKRTCLLLINNLYFLMENIVSLPNDVSLTMKLFYYADGVCLFLIVTPPEYQPPGFKEGESEFILFEGIPVHVKVGEIETSFHMLKLKILKREERIDSMDIHGILKECREDAEREKEQRRDTLGEYINTEYEPPGSEEEFIDKYHKVNDEATRKRKLSKKKKKNK
ncbi:HORMA domain-containing protein 1-like isoform X3 [Mauremys reevesii]|nr:HORMA domain-containing protein 1-like isoform X3 [Mauremys reevesii]XP_039342559.1 HORMA domain-containing protein 1-like isoform X3 [Mauremys reevesii]XP_039342560.1 HORMA domain-containing protein 1-like isoform X3 [Mauremys reevesii]